MDACNPIWIERTWRPLSSVASARPLERRRFAADAAICGDPLGIDEMPRVVHRPRSLRATLPRVVRRTTPRNTSAASATAAWKAARLLTLNVLEPPQKHVFGSRMRPPGPLEPTRVSAHACADRIDAYDRGWAKKHGDGFAFRFERALRACAHLSNRARSRRAMSRLLCASSRRARAQRRLHHPDRHRLHVRRSRGARQLTTSVTPKF